MALQINDTAPDFEGTLPPVGSDSMTGRATAVRDLFASEGLHAGVHDRARLYGRLKPEFDKRNCKIMGLSVDPVENHKDGRRTLRRSRVRLRPTR